MRLNKLGRIPMLTRRLIAAALALAPLMAAPAVAQTWPTRPITLVVPWAAGGGADFASRLMAGALERELGMPVTVVNRTGGNGVVGHSAIATAPPDGYTIGMATSEIAYLKTMGLADITPDSYDIISTVLMFPAGISVKADAPFKTAADFIKALRDNPKNTYSASGAGAGGSWHMAIAGLTKAAGMGADRVRWVPSAGGAPALQEVVAGGITMFSGSPAEAKSLAEAGRVRILMLMADARSPAFPDVPTLKENGVNWSFNNWFALVAPKNLPPAIRTRLTEAAAKAHATAEVQGPLKERGFIPQWSGPEQGRAFATGFATTARNILVDLGLAKE
jgi:tripartite-type tricarboxylate transporter receptor subunit TctC